MTTGELVDLFQTHKLNTGGTDHQNATLRKRAVEAIQETVEEVWDEADWDNKKVTTTGSLASAADSADTPSDFDGFGEGGGLFIQSGGQWSKLEYMDPASLFEERETNRSSAGIPLYYTVAQQDTDYLTQVFFDRPADATYSLRFYYDSIPPLVQDRPTALTATAGSAGNVDGTVIYRVVFVGSDGSESEAGATTSITVSSKQVALTAIPAGTTATTSRKLYRTNDSGSTYMLLDTISDNTTTTYTDNIADGSLGATMTTSATTSSLKRIPEKYHRSVVLKGLLSKRSSDLGSGMAQEYEGKYRAELARMKARRKPGLEDLERIGGQGLGTFRMH